LDVRAIAGDREIFEVAQHAEFGGVFDDTINEELIKDAILTEERVGQ
jgi:hypothetical protein